MQRADTLHNRLVDRACSAGWNRLPWKANVCKVLGAVPWRDAACWEDGESEIWDMINEIRCVPDAWRIRVEGEEAGWLHPVLALEFLEVEVTHPVNDAKLIQYDRLWWRLDATEEFHLRVFRMDKYGIVSPLITEDSAYHVLGYLHGPDGRRANGGRKRAQSSTTPAAQPALGRPESPILTVRQPSA